MVVTVCVMVRRRRDQNEKQDVRNVNGDVQVLRHEDCAERTLPSCCGIIVPAMLASDTGFLCETEGERSRAVDGRWSGKACGCWRFEFIEVDRQFYGEVESQYVQPPKRDYPRFVDLEAFPSVHPTVLRLYS